MSQWTEVRHLHLVEGVAKKQIARRLQLDIKTVRRALAQPRPLVRGVVAAGAQPGPVAGADRAVAGPGPPATATGSRPPHATRRPAGHRRCHDNSARRDVASRRFALSGLVATIFTTPRGSLFTWPKGPFSACHSQARYSGCSKKPWRGGFSRRRSGKPFAHTRGR